MVVYPLIFAIRTAIGYYRNLYEMKYKKFVEERLEALPLQNRIEKFVDDVKSITRLNDLESI